MTEPLNIAHIIPDEDDIMTDEDIMPPSPDDVALAAMEGLLASGVFESPAAAVHTAWSVCVPEFYRARAHYANVIAPALFGSGPQDQ